MNRKAFFFSLSALMFAATTVSAVPTGEWRDSYGHMTWGGGYGMFGGLLMLVSWGIIIALIVLAVRWLANGQSGRSTQNALDVLQERFAKGEIDEEEFSQRKKVLENRQL